MWRGQFRNYSEMCVRLSNGSHCLRAQLSLSIHMASSLRSNNTIALLFPSSSPSRSITKTPNCLLPIRCGPRDNRGPLLKGRTLSSEAIQAIQALKRAKSDESKINQIVSKTLTRLIKADLLASFHELLRQNQCRLALKVFSTVRTEVWYKTDFALYADLVLALARNGMADEIDGLVMELEREEGLLSSDSRGLSRLIRALVGAGRTESLVRVYGVMKRCGWSSRFRVEEYVAKVLSRGLKRLGETGVGDEVCREFLGLGVDEDRM